MLRKLFCVVLALGVFRFAVAEEVPTLNSIMQGELTYPEVQAELKVTHKQLWVQQSRQFALIMMMAVGMSQASNDSGSQGDDKPDAAGMAALFKGSSASMSLLVEDLDTKQQARLRQITIQKDRLEVLSTSELILALELSPSQQERLKIINSDLAAQKAPATKKAADKFATAMTKTFAGFEEIPDDKKMAQVAMKMQEIVPMFANSMYEMNNAGHEFDAKAEVRALNVLTPSQRSKLVRLGGKKVSW